MIVKRETGDALYAPEKYLLVPYPANSKVVPKSGFAGDVVSKYPNVSSGLSNIKPGGYGIEFGNGESFEVESLENERKKRTLLFVAIHKVEDKGWGDSAEALEECLGSLYDSLGGLSIATAGIPGTGFSGVKGAANPEAIKSVLDLSSHRFTVYDINHSGDKESRDLTPPFGSAEIALSSPG